jgi:hypothetical protein
MAFLTDDDYKSQVKDNILANVLEGTASLRVDAERKAQEQMISALNVRFDVTAIFAATGDARNAEVVMYMVDMVLYHLHSRINPGQVPEVRKHRYEDAMSWMKSVAGGKLEPNLPKPDVDGEDSKADVQYGSRTKRDTYW